MRIMSLNDVLGLLACLLEEFNSFGSLRLEKQCLWSSIIVIGNRSKFTPQTIIDFFTDHELYPEFVLVEFKKPE